MPMSSTFLSITVGPETDHHSHKASDHLWLKTAQDLLFSNHHDLLTFKGDPSRSIFFVHDPVAGLEHGLDKRLLNHLPFLILFLLKPSLPDGQDLPFLGPFPCHVGNHNPAGRLLLWFSGLNHGPIL